MLVVSLVKLTEKGHPETWPSCYDLRCPSLKVGRRILQNTSFHFDFGGGWGGN